MTVTYSSDIATAHFMTLFKLLFTRWRGSVMKLIWKHLIIYLLIFYTIFFIGTFRVGKEGHKKFIAIAKYFKNFTDAVPLSFVLGFFVSNVMTRWWAQFKSIPWPYSIAVYVSCNITGYDEVGRAMRRTIMRYVCLSLTMVFRVLSPRVKARFPKFGDLVEAGLLTKSELKIIEQMETDWPGYSKHWVPIVWAAALVNRARAQGRIRDDFLVKTLIKEMNRFRGLCGELLNYNAICIPLVYIQVVTIAVYSYFIGCLFAHQFIGGSDPDIELSPWGMDYFPALTTLQFIFYMGWLKVAETMLNPFGEDDDDFDVNRLIDHNMIMTYLIVDEMHNEHPELLKDQYWDSMPGKLPDRAENDNPKAMEMTEIFDVIEKKEKRPNSVYVTDIESAINSNEMIAETINEAELIPTTNIDENYLRVSDVDIKQSNLERKMKKRREEISGEESDEI